MSERKINDSVMLAMLDKGKKQAEIAEFFSVSPQAISDRVKKLRGGVVKNVVMERAAEVIDKNLNTVEQLQKINKAAHQVLDELMGKEKVVQELGTVVEKILEGNPADVKEITKLVKQIISDKNTALKACQEIRGQLSLQLDIFKTLYDMKAVAEFQKEVLTAIGEASPEVKNAIIDKLNQRRIIRQSIQFD